MQVEVGLETFSTGTNLLYVHVFRSAKYHENVARFVRIGKYPLSLVGNIDQTPAFFDMVLSKCTSKKGERECVVRSSGSEKKNISHSRWTNVSYYDHFQSKDWANYLQFKHPSCFYCQNTWGIWLMDLKCKYWKVALISFKNQLVVPRNANQWMLASINHSIPYWEDVEQSTLQVLLKVFPMQILTPVLNSLYQQVNTWSNG